MRTLKTEAIVLRRTNYGEADRILQLLTPYGKKSVMAKGVRREKSRLAGGIELFAICNVVIGESRGDLSLLTSARMDEFFGHIVEDYDRMQFAYTVIKLISRLSDGIDDADLYEILVEVLKSLNQNIISLDLIKVWFYLNYAKVTGYELSLRHDATGSLLLSDKKYSYDISERGFRESENGDIQSSHIKLLRLLSTSSIVAVSRVGGITDILSNCLDVVLKHASI